MVGPPAVPEKVRGEVAGFVKRLVFGCSAAVWGDDQDESAED